MAQFTSVLASAHEEGPMRIVSSVTGAMLHLARQTTCTPSREAKARPAWLDWHARHGHNVSRTCRRFGLSRETFYRWKRRYDVR